MVYKLLYGILNINTTMLQNVYIAAAKRTPIGSFMGLYHQIPGFVLASHVIGKILDSLPSTLHIDSLILGNVLQSGQGQNPTKQAAYLTKLPETTVSYTLNSGMLSGMKSIIYSANEIQSNSIESSIAGGFESLSTAPYIVPGNRLGYSSHEHMYDSILHDELICSMEEVIPTGYAEKTNLELSIGHFDQNYYAEKTYEKARMGYHRHFFDREIVKFEGISKDEEMTYELKDQITRSSQAIHMSEGTINMFNSAKLGDGACAVLLIHERLIQQFNIQPIARIVAHTHFACDSHDFVVSPMECIKKLLKIAGLRIAQVDLWEIHEECSTVPLVIEKKLEVLKQKINVNGGSIALGNPFGMTGARLVTTLAWSLKESGKRLGLAVIGSTTGESCGVILENSY